MPAYTSGAHQQSVLPAGNFLVTPLQLSALKGEESVYEYCFYNSVHLKH
jgi:hypothetical protein